VISHHAERDKKEVIFTPKSLINFWVSLSLRSSSGLLCISGYVFVDVVSVIIKIYKIKKKLLHKGVIALKNFSLKNQQLFRDNYTREVSSTICYVVVGFSCFLNYIFLPFLFRTACESIVAISASVFQSIHLSVILVQYCNWFKSWVHGVKFWFHERIWDSSIILLYRSFMLGFVLQPR